MSPHHATNPGSEVVSPVAGSGLARGVQSLGHWPNAGNDLRRHSSTNPLERQSRNRQLRQFRQHFHREAVEKRDRQLRVLAYSLVPSPGASPREDWNTLQAEAEQQGYAIGARLHDVAVPLATTYFPSQRANRAVCTPPGQRPGWGEVERLIGDGFADGVIVLDRHNVSSDDNEYHTVIKELGDTYQAFVHLVIPEEPTAPT